MWLTDVSIRRPQVLLAVLALILVGGLTAWTRLGVDLLPAVDFPIVAVTTVYPGAAPEIVDAQVTQKITDAVAGINDVDYVNATSVEGTSVVVIFFTDRASRDSALEVERRIASVRGDLPADARAPTVGKFDPSGTPVISLALSGSRDLGQLQRLAETRIKGRLEALEGVAQVSILGGLQREIQVQVDQGKLQATGLSILQVNQALGADNLSVPAGSISERNQDWTLRLNALAQTPDDLGEVLVAATPSGSVRLADVATVADTYQKPTTIQRLDGHPAVGIVVQKQTGANAVATAEAVKRAVGQIAAELPPDTRLTTVVNSSVFTRQSIADVERELGQAVVLTGLVLLVFLHTFRSTAIVLLSIPTSLIATLGAAYVLGLTLNIISLMGLTLTVGILVNDSIVVLENIFRHRQDGENPWQAALRGRSEIGLAAIAITLVNVVVFLPLAFMTGPVGGYFRQFGIVVSAATLFSLLMSFTLTPMLASRWLGANDRLLIGGATRLGITRRLGLAWDRGYERLAHGYGRLVGASLRVRWLPVLLGIASLAGGLALLLSGMLATEYAPNPDNSQFVVTLELPAGATLEATDQAVQTVESRLREWPEVEHVFSSVGVGGSGSLGLNRARFATLQVGLVPRQARRLTPAQLAQKARALGADIPGVTVRANPVGLLGQGRPTEIDVIVQGEDQDTLGDLARQVARILRATPGLADVTDGGVSGQPEVVATIDHRRAADFGITPAQVAGILRTGLTGNVASTFRPDGSTGWPIRVLLNPAAPNTTENVANIPIVSPRGATTTLGQFTDISVTTGPSLIARHDRQRSVTATASLTGERPLGSVTRDLRAALGSLALPNGYTVELGGAVQRQSDTFGQVGQALMLSIAMMYVLLVLLYGSWLQPLVRMLSLPLGLFGAFGLLALTGNSLNLMSLIGLILTEGLVGKNAILLVDYTNTLRHRGMQRTDALVEAARTRLRPILMTSATIILAMLPVVLSIGEGSEWRVPMAMTVIGGLLSSTLLALVFVPCVYTLLDDLEHGVRRLLHVDAEPSWTLEPAPVVAPVRNREVRNGVGTPHAIPAAHDP